MKKIILLLLTIGFAAPVVFALRPGDPVEELARVKWIQGDPLRLLPPAKPKSDTPRFKVVTFLLTRASNAPQTLAMLHALNAAHRGKVKMAVITPDPESDAEALLQTVPGASIPLGLDKDRKLTLKYMGASLLFPMSFIVGEKGKILWCGEAVDAGEALGKCLNGTFDAAVEEEISPWLDQMQTLLRENNDRKLASVASAVFRRDPDNPAALRLRLFALENSGRIPVAWKFLEERLEAAPASARLYFTVVDFILRYPAFGNRLNDVLGRFSTRVRERDRRLFMAWTLLRNFQFNAVALEWAARLAVPMPGTGPESFRTSGMALMVKALLAYRCGRIDAALPALAEAEALWKRNRAEKEAAEARGLADFMRRARSVKLP